MPPFVGRTDLRTPGYAIPKTANMHKMEFIVQNFVLNLSEYS
jgi:hypothetical protein